MWVDINKNSSELLVQTVKPKYSDGRDHDVNYTISIQTHLNLVVKNVNAKIIEKLLVQQNGKVELSFKNGIIELNIPQNTSANFSASLTFDRLSYQLNHNYDTVVN